MSTIACLRIEGLAVLALSLLIYAHHGEGWLLFAALFLMPDVSMLGYALGPSPGAALYNAGHTYTMPLVMAAVALLLSHTLLLSVALTWTAHIGFDRMLGYGLKRRSGFHDTHLGRIGSVNQSRPETTRIVVPSSAADADDDRRL